MSVFAQAFDSGSDVQQNSPPPLDDPDQADVQADEHSLWDVPPAFLAQVAGEQVIETPDSRDARPFVTNDLQQSDAPSADTQALVAAERGMIEIRWSHIVLNQAAHGHRLQPQQTVQQNPHQAPRQITQQTAQASVHQAVQHATQQAVRPANNSHSFMRAETEVGSGSAHADQSPRLVNDVVANDSRPIVERGAQLQRATFANPLQTNAPPASRLVTRDTAGDLTLETKLRPLMANAPKSNAGQALPMTGSDSELSQPTAPAIQSSKPPATELQLSTAASDHAYEAGRVDSAQDRSRNARKTALTSGEPAWGASEAVINQHGLTRPTRLSVDVATPIVEAITIDQSAQPNQRTRLEVELDPPELGKVTVELSESRDGVVARITASRESTAQLVESQLSTIRASLENAGVQVSDFQVGRDGQPYEQRDTFGNSANHYPAHEQPDELADASEPENGDRQNASVGYRGTRIDVRF